jgi:glycosyltransferase involved in cell wall biosynthesis
MLGWKRVDTLIRAVALCRAQGSACHLRIIGQGPRESDLKRLALRGTCNDAITFEPSIPIDSVRAAMRQADVYVLPSNGYEGWGAVVNEAMLEACCVVATREAGSASTLIRHGENGLLFQSGDVQGLAEQLLHLEQDEPLRKRLAQAGQQTLLTDWTPAVAAERLLELSEALIAGRPPPIYTEGPLQQL